VTADPSDDDTLYNDDYFDFIDNRPPFAFTGGGAGQAPEEPPAEEKEIVVTAPSKGQEDFAKDGDPFNDGEAPTGQTVLAWLEQMLADGVIKSFSFLERGKDGDAYSGTYTHEWGSTSFTSDGGELYGQFPTDPPEPLPGPYEVTRLDGGWDFGSDPNVHLF
jgi:hypothetical protein